MSIYRSSSLPEQRVDARLYIIVFFIFSALKTRHSTPKYGLLYHAHLVGQANTKVKGKMSRMLAAKAALMTRVDALGESEEMDSELGLKHRAALNRRLQFLEEGQVSLRY